MNANSNLNIWRMSKDTINNGKFTNNDLVFVVNFLDKISTNQKVINKEEFLFNRVILFSNFCERINVKPDAIQFIKINSMSNDKKITVKYELTTNFIISGAKYSIFCSIQKDANSNFLNFCFNSHNLTLDSDVNMNDYYNSSSIDRLNFIMDNNPSELKEIILYFKDLLLEIKDEILVEENLKIQELLGNLNHTFIGILSFLIEKEIIHNKKLSQS